MTTIGPRVGGDDAPHELVLLAGERHRLAITALGLPVVVRADHDHRDVRRCRRRRGALDRVGVRRGARTHDESTDEAASLLARVDLDDVLATCLERHHGAYLGAAEAEERVAAFWRRVVDGDLTVDAHDRRTDAREAQRPRARLVGDEATPYPSVELALVHALCRRRHPHEVQPLVTGRGRSAGRIAVGDVEGPAHRRHPLVDRAAALVGDIDPLRPQRVEWARGIDWADACAASSLDLPGMGVRSDERDRGRRRRTGAARRRS